MLWRLKRNQVLTEIYFILNRICSIYKNGKKPSFGKNERIKDISCFSPLNSRTGLWFKNCNIKIMKKEESENSTRKTKEQKLKIIKEASIHRVRETLESMAFI